MLAMRCYPPVMAKESETGEMTEFGQELWAMIQRRGRFSQAAIGRRIGERTGWKPSRQAINHWLYGTRDVPRDLVPAVVKAFALTDEEERTLKDLYFYGQGDSLEERFRKGEEGEQEEGGTLPGGARDPKDLREGLDSIAEARRRSGEADDRETDRGRRA